MTLSKHFHRGCMKLEATRKHQTRKQRKVNAGALFSKSASVKSAQTALSKKKIAELLFERCIYCTKMAAIPQGAFAANKVRRNHERSILISPIEEKGNAVKESAYNARSHLEGWELTPLKYNSKLMNSIWGLYNRYSVHNFKKNTDDGMLAAVWGAVQSNSPAVETAPVLGTGSGL